MKKLYLLVAAGLLFASSAFSWTIEKGYYYFDNTNTQWSKVYMRVGSTTWVNVIAMTQEPNNLNLWKAQITDQTSEKFWYNVDAIQFAAVPDYNATTSCGQDCGIYNGNVIPSGQKTEYFKGDVTIMNPLFVAGTSNVSGYRGMTSLQNMPSTVTLNTLTVNGASPAGAFFEAGQKCTLNATATLAFTATGGGKDNLNHATLNCKKASSEKTGYVLMSGNGSASKTSTSNITMPSAVGDYTMTASAVCGGVSSNTASYTYHVMGLTGSDLNFGAVETGGKTVTMTESLSNVWGNGAVANVTATITGTGRDFFKFVGTDEERTASIAIADKAGSIDIAFTTGQEAGKPSATLTLAFSYGDDKTYTKTYTLSGDIRANGIVAAIGAKPDLLSGPTAKLHGYVKYTGCNTFSKCGFIYGTSAASLTYDIESTNTKTLNQGDTWEATTPTLEKNTTYYYRSYIYDGSKYWNSEELGTFTTTDKCNFDWSKDTIYVYVDNSQDGSDCVPRYKTIEAAIDFVATNEYLATSRVLNKEVIMVVTPTKTPYGGTETKNVTGGKAQSCTVTKFNNINNTTTPPHHLTVKTAEGYTSQATILHVEVSNCKNIIFDNVRIEGHSTPFDGVYDNAVDIDKAVSHDTQKADWEFTSNVTNSGLVFKNCYIYSQGFTCFHVSAYEDILVENCDIHADLPDTMYENEDTNKAGASIKFIHCSNIRLLRNNFRGSHATSIWAQGLNHSLIMNNVFWNDNKAYYSSYPNNVTFIRLFSQYDDDKNNNLGIYYNTMYLAANTTTTDRKVDFFRLHGLTGFNAYGKSGDQQTYYDYSTIRFMYNNCYSYDLYVSGRNKDNATVADRSFCVSDESNWCTAVKFNNFWSKYDLDYDETTSVFNVGCATKYVNVEDQVCSTASSDPSTLVIQGSGLNFGSAPTTNYGGENSIFTDRLHGDNGAGAVRNAEGEWTLGAYQQTGAGTPLEKIIWTGAEDTNWDNRNNWVKEDGKILTCVDYLTSNLVAVIPYSEDIKNYPMLPDKFSGVRTKFKSESVNAGHGVTFPTKFVGTIELEYGASIKGVSALNDDEARRYDAAKNSFEADRKEYILVGTVIKPFINDEKNSVRLVKSGDYFLNFEPHVYMYKAKATGDAVNWQTPFADLDEEVNYDEVFSILIPNQYGPNKLPANYYYTRKKPNPAMVDDATRIKTYNCEGWFLNDEIYPEYKVNSTGSTLLCNTYPANIMMNMAQTYNNGIIKYYNYGEREFQTSGSNKTEIKSQNGFLFTPTAGQNDGFFRITKDMLSNSSTKYKTTTAEPTYFYIKASNPSGTDGSSSAGIYYDALKADEYVSGVDLTNTTIDGMSTKPEIYVNMYGKELDKVTVPDIEKEIPLGLVLQSAMTVEFSCREMNDIETATLDDRETGMSYDLLTVKPQIALAKGTYTGRFYLNLAEKEIPTDVEEETSASGNSSIDIYGDSKAVIISSSENVILKSAEITDMAGRTTTVILKNPHYNKVNIKGAQGVYVVKVIGDTKSETTKVIVK